MKKRFQDSQYAEILINAIITYSNIFIEKYLLSTSLSICLYTYFLCFASFIIYCTLYQYNVVPPIRLLLYLVLGELQGVKKHSNKVST